MKTTITEYKPMSCAKCGGAGRIACFQHMKGGECFRCGGTGADPIMAEVSREMTDDEVISALRANGFNVIMEEFTPVGDDFLDALFGDAVMEFNARRQQAMTGARMLLAAI